MIMHVGTERVLGEKC